MSEFDTPTEMLQPGDDSSARWWQDQFSRRLAIVVIVVVALVIGSSLVPAQWLGRIIPGHSIVDDGSVVLKPGSASSAESRVTIVNLPVYGADGEILFTTVRIDSRVTVWDWAMSALSDDIELGSREEIFGTRTVTEQRERSLELMQGSKDSAVVAALGILGVQAIEATGVGFNGVVEDGPVDGILEVGEVIIVIDDSLITDFDSLRVVLNASTPGQTATFTVEHHETGALRTIDVVYGVRPDTPGAAFVGIEGPEVRAIDVDLPFEIEIDSGSIGGPSAGLAFALTLIDLLTEGDLTGGNRVAVTGTITAGGAVGNIGGVGQKAAAALNEGADLFIVPADLVDTATEHAGDMPVIGVANLEEALAALADLGGETSELALNLTDSGVLASGD